MFTLNVTLLYLKAFQTEYKGFNLIIIKLSYFFSFFYFKLLQLGLQIL